MKIPKILFSALLFLGMMVALVACSIGVANTTLSDGDVLLTAQAANPLPTEFSAQSLTTVRTKSCQIQSFTATQSNNDQGDMIAWSPVEDVLAYVTPQNDKWGWFIGNLVLYDVKAGKKLYESQNLAVAGDLTWSPDGKMLAFVVLDQQAKTYTVDVFDLDTSGIMEVFDSASEKTDQWSSTKAVDSWQDEHTLWVTSSCDVDCSRRYSFDTQTGELTTLEEMRKGEDTALTVTNETASQDGRWQLAQDVNDNVWMASAINHQTSMIAENVLLTQVKWSRDSSYFAIYSDESVLVYEPICQN
jgi:dipeptidyl aminopeptidase/acylaminoacyl peptidase